MGIIGKYKTALYVVMAVIIFIAVNVIGSHSLTKYDIDLTEGGMYTISKGTRHILDNMDEPVTLRFFYSGEVANGIPIIKSYAARIRGLLEDYVRYSKGHIKLKVIDPKPFSDEEDLALSYGMTGVDMDQLGTKAYMGLVASNSVDDVKAVPIFALEREKYLEYEVTRMIYDLNNPKRKKVGLVSSEKLGAGPMMGIQQLGGGSDWLVIQQIKQTFDVEDLGDNVAVIPADVDVLMVVQPYHFSDDTLYAIDQYVMKGGRVLFFADPNKEGGGTGNPADRSFSANANKLLSSWGITIDPGKIVEDRQAARKMDKGDDPDKTWNVVNFLPWLNLREQNINSDDMVTSLLKSININTAGYIEELGFTDVKVTPLIQSNEDSAVIPVNEIRPAKDPERLLREFRPDTKKYTLAARITGFIKSAYPGRASIPGHIGVSRDEAHIIIVADMDILRDENWADKVNYKDNNVVVSPKADNSSFVVNALDHLSGSTDLMSLRGRGALKRPFTVVEKLRRDSEAKFVAKQQELNEKLATTEKRLSDLKDMAEAQVQNSMLYKQEQQIEISRFTNEMADIKKQAREIKGELRKDMERLGSILKFINIWLMPIIVACFAIFIFLIKGAETKRKYKR